MTPKTRAKPLSAKVKTGAEAKEKAKAKTKAKTGASRATKANVKADPKTEAQRAQLVYEALSRAYPDATCALEHDNAYQLLVATILSAQCTDVRVNMVTPALFKRYPTPQALAAAKQDDVEEMIKSTGFFRNKAKSLIGMAQAVVAEHGGEIPRTMEELRALPGVGRKTANVVLGNAYGINAGITVDTHVTRLSQLLGFTKHTDAEKIERDLMPLFPREEWTQLSHLLIAHGRQICIARRPKCSECVVNRYCPSARLP